MVTGHVVRREGLGGFWGRWTLYTTAGEFIGFAVPAAVGALVASAVEGSAGPAGALLLVLAVALAGLVEGATLSYGQWLALRRALPGMAAREWVVPTMVAAGIAYLFGMAPSTLMDLGVTSMAVLIGVAVVLGALLLVSIGYAQWLTLRRYVPNAIRWIPANALAWTLGLVAPFGAIAAVPDGSPLWGYIAAGVASGLLMGAIVGAITGVAMVRLLRAADSG